jgi:hypothetical protein
MTTQISSANPSRWVRGSSVVYRRLQYTAHSPLIAPPRRPVHLP